MKPLTRQQSRALAVGLLVLAVAAIAGAIAWPAVLLHRHYDAKIADIETNLQRFRRFGAQGAEFKRVLDEAKGRDASGFFLKAKVPALAGAELQELVRAKIEGAGGKTPNLQIGNPKDEGPYRQITVSVTAFATHANLQKALYALETMQPYTFIDNITIQTQYFVGYKPVPGDDKDLTVRMDISAYALREDKK